MRVVYVVMQRTPFPGRWEALPAYQIQQAEYKLKLGRRYGERATRIGKSFVNPVYAYTFEDAQAIIGYWRGQRDWADYVLMGHVIH